MNMEELPRVCDKAKRLALTVTRYADWLHSTGAMGEEVLSAALDFMRSYDEMVRDDVKRPRMAPGRFRNARWNNGSKD